MGDHLLVLSLDLVKELTQQLQFPLGGLNHSGDSALHGGCTCRSCCNLLKAALSLLNDSRALPQGFLGAGDAFAQPVGPAFHLIDAGIHLARQLLDFLRQFLDL